MAFRDGVLTKTAVGQELIRLYHEWSPVVVEIMEEDKAFRKELREMMDGMLPLIG